MILFIELFVNVNHFGFHIFTRLCELSKSSIRIIKMLLNCIILSFCCFIKFYFHYFIILFNIIKDY